MQKKNIKSKCKQFSLFLLSLCCDVFHKFQSNDFFKFHSNDFFQNQCNIFTEIPIKTTRKRKSPFLNFNWRSFPINFFKWKPRPRTYTKRNKKTIFYSLLLLFIFVSCFEMDAKGANTKKSMNNSKLKQVKWSARAIENVEL